MLQNLKISDTIIHFYLPEDCGHVHRDMLSLDSGEVTVEDDQQDIEWDHAQLLNRLDNGR